MSEQLQRRLFSETETRRRIDIDWRPNPGPQTEAYESEADVLGYGGAAGGGKTDLILGLAATCHKHSVIFRRVFPNLRAVIERSREILSGEQDHGRDRYNESLHRWALPGGQMLEFEACQYEADKEKQRGRPRDFYAFDEATEFTKSQIMFIIAWLRSTVQGQRCRVVLTFNPPTSESGNWITEYFRAWLAYIHPEQFQHPNPARPGELRWFATVNGEEREFPDGAEVEIDGERVRPLSRTFIPARLSDNPYLDQTNYRAVLQSMPEPFRSQLLNGDFAATAEGDPWQVIPISLIDRAMSKWQQSDKPVTRLGVDVARGGQDRTVLAPIHTDGTCGQLLSVPGILTPDGQAVSKLVWERYEPDGLAVAVDVIGVGSSPVDFLRERGFNVTPIAGSARAIVEEYGEEKVYTDETSGLKCVNLRAAVYWNLRKLMEQDLIALPPDPELKQDLAAQRWTPTSGGIKLMPKETVKEATGKSPDKSDAVAYGYWLPLPFVGINPWDAAGLCCGAEL
jgi:hypothetical protein